MTWLLLALLAHDPITTKITWDAEISRIMNRRCLSCHKAGSGVDFSNYEQTRPWAKAATKSGVATPHATLGRGQRVRGFSERPISHAALEIENPHAMGGKAAARR